MSLSQVVIHARETAWLESIHGVLEWDERTYLPAGAQSYRAEQITYLAGLIHRRRTDPQLGEWLQTAASEVAREHPQSDAASIVRNMHRDFRKRTKLPQRLVEELAKTCVEGQQAWVVARRENDFLKLRPFLERLVRLKLEQAEAVGYAESPYDALLDDYEPGETAANIASVFAGLRDELVSLLRQIISAPSAKTIDQDLLHRHYPIGEQEKFGRYAATKIGFDFSRGRLDVTDHPFCTEVGPHDCRITTRYDERFFPAAFFGTLHEAGHGIYEQGLRTDQYGLPPGKYLSMSIHESQSRLWENMVGRSRSFWEFFFPRACESFPAALQNTSLDAFYRAINRVAPSLIRVEADEVTYGLHVIARFELEQALMSRTLSVADLPTAWNQKYRDLLDVNVPDDAQGVLQDVHWSAGLFGYFPTYSLGNLYAAQFFDKAREELGDLDAMFRAGEFRTLRQWLNSQVHQLGQNVTAGELVLKVTGKPVTHLPFMEYLRCKMGKVYSLES